MALGWTNETIALQPQLYANGKVKSSVGVAANAAIMHCKDSHCSARRPNSFAKIMQEITKSDMNRCIALGLIYSSSSSRPVTTIIA